MFARKYLPGERGDISRARNQPAELLLRLPARLPSRVQQLRGALEASGEFEALAHTASRVQNRVVLAALHPLVVAAPATRRIAACGGVILVEHQREHRELTPLVLAVEVASVRPQRR